MSDAKAELGAYLTKLAEIRVVHTAKSILVKKLYEKFNAENKQALDELSEARQELDLIEAELRDRVVKAHKATGAKKFCDGKLGIRIVKMMTFDESEALAWAIESGADNCLSLQKTNFKKVAEGLALPFVSISEIAQATIAKDL